MRAVLMSIRPEWCELIASGKKTVEIRKTIPRKFVHDRFYGGYISEPFKVYIYETMGHTATPWMDEDGHMIFQGRGEVIGEFVCDKITELAPINKADDTVEEKSCMSREEIVRYLKGKGYAWNISDLVIYDKPKGLGAFRVPCGEYNKDNPMCGDCRYYHYHYEYPAECICEGMKPITRPPQSWCYVEELKREKWLKEY